MATFQSEFYTLISGLSGIDTHLGTSPLRFFPQNADVRTTLPYAVYTRTSENGNPHLTGVTNLAEAIYEISILGDDTTEVTAAADFFRTELDGMNNETITARNIRRIILLDESDTYEDIADGSQRPLDRIDMDFQIFYTRATS